MNFSQRYGYTSVREVIQLESIDEPLRNGLWSLLKIHCWDCFNSHYMISLSANNTLLKEGLNRSFFLRRSSHGGIFRGRRCGFCLLSLTLSYFFVALMPFVRLFLHNRRTMTY